MNTLLISPTSPRWGFYFLVRNKLVRTPNKKAVRSFLSLISPPNTEHPEWRSIRQFLYHDKNCNQKISFKLFLYYLKAHMENLEVVNPHYVQQYVQAEEEFVTNYIYLENFSSEISNFKNIYGLKKSPLNLLTTSWHHLSENTLFKGDYRDADITDPLFPRFPTYDSFYDSETIQLVEDIFNKDFTIYKSHLIPL